MNRLINQNNGKLIGYGNQRSQIQFLLPSPPPILEDNQGINDIVSNNGNHWRKIFVIIAKLVCHIYHDNIDNQHLKEKKKTWQEFRDNDLLNHVYLNFDDTPMLNKKLNFVCGKAHAINIRLFEQAQHWQAIDELGRIRTNKGEPQILLTPYLDYRQFPNQLITQTVDFLNIEFK